MLHCLSLLLQFLFIPLFRAPSLASLCSSDTHTASSSPRAFALTGLSSLNALPSATWLALLPPALWVFAQIQSLKEVSLAFKKKKGSLPFPLIAFSTQLIWL